MNDIKSIAYLYASMMDSDGKIATKELESWYQMVEKRWPDFQKEVAGNILLVKVNFNILCFKKILLIYLD